MLKITVSNDYSKIPDQLPLRCLFPRSQQAIAFAQQQLQSTGKFKGMLFLGIHDGNDDLNLQKDMSGAEDRSGNNSFGWSNATY